MSAGDDGGMVASSSPNEPIRWLQAICDCDMSRWVGVVRKKNKAKNVASSFALLRWVSNQSLWLWSWCGGSDKGDLMWSVIESSCEGETHLHHC